jgi:hypothetical protein
MGKCIWIIRLGFGVLLAALLEKLE